MLMLNKKQFIAIYNWVNHKSIKTFIAVYRDAFDINFMWWRPLWRCWRIFRNTYINKRYSEIAKAKEMQHFYLN